jgi:hypothetical protein
MGKVNVEVDMKEGDVIVVELAKDVELLREALEALGALAEYSHDWHEPDGSPILGLEDANRKARAAITKLEERLLRE